MYNPPGQQPYQFQQSGPQSPNNNSKNQRGGPSAASKSPSAAPVVTPYIPMPLQQQQQYNPNPNPNPAAQSNLYIPPAAGVAQSQQGNNPFKGSLLNSSTNPYQQTAPTYQTNPFQPGSAAALNTSARAQQPNTAPYQPPHLHQNQFNSNNKGQSMDQYINEFQSSATGQIGMQLGTQALSSAKQHISSNVGRYFDIVQWRYYFNVSNSYVLNKLQLLIFPFLHKGWTRIVEQTDDNGQVGAYAPPRSDLNAPDLYIPVMSFITYVIITGIMSGLDSTAAAAPVAGGGKVGKGFTPDVLGLTASTAFFLTLFDVFFVKMGNYFLNVTADSPILELFAYSGYKFIPISTVLLIKHFAGSWTKIVAFSYLFFAYGFFTLRSLRSLVIPETNGGTMNDVPGSARKQRVVYLFIIVLIQSVISWILI